jgi:hypothetical protein
MIACLVTAIILGFIFGWLLSKTTTKKRHLSEIKILNNSLSEGNFALEESQKAYQNEQLNIEKITIKNGELNVDLLEKSTLLEVKNRALWKVQKELNLTKSSLNESSDTKEHNQVLIEKIMSLEKLTEKKDKESRGLESVLLRADSIIEERNNTIKLLEEKLKVYKESRTMEEEEELLITKDQFTQIENQLLLYQQEIFELKEANKTLSECKRDSSLVEEKKSDKELDDLAIVKLFGDTYKKIIKS